jgi:hypothetical protein
MKTPSLDLFNFIHAMSSAEKRYFKKDTRDSNTLDLFDIINEMEAYDEELVKSRLKDSSFAGNLKVHKNRLQQILLKNLRSFHEEKTAQSRIRVLIDNAEIFQKKKMFEQAMSQLDKAIQYAEIYEEYELKLQALGIKSRLSTNLTDFEPFNVNVLTDMAYCVRQIQNFIHLAAVNEKILQTVNLSTLSKTAQIEKIESILNAEIHEKGADPISSQAERLYLHTNAIISDLKGDLITACRLSKKIVDNLASNAYLIEEKNELFLNAIINYLDFCCRLPNSAKEFIIYVEKAESHCSIFEQLQPNLLNIYFSYLVLLRKEHQFETMTALYELKINELIEKYRLESSYLTAKAQLMILEANFAQQNYEAVGELLHKLLNSKKAVPKEFLIAVQIVELMHNYEMYHFDFLENIILNIQNKIRKMYIESRFIENLLNLFLKVAKSNISEHKSLFQLYRTSIPSFENDPYFRQLNSYLDLGLWFDAHIRKQPYSLIIKENKRTNY